MSQFFGKVESIAAGTGNGIRKTACRNDTGSRRITSLFCPDGKAPVRMVHSQYTFIQVKFHMLFLQAMIQEFTHFNSAVGTGEDTAAPFFFRSQPPLMHTPEEVFITESTVGVRAMKSVIGAVFVRLQRPLPVIPIFFPTISFFSKSCTPAPLEEAAKAAKIPAAPAPTTITCFIAINTLFILV